MYVSKPSVGQPAPVRVVGGRQRRHLVVRSGSTAFATSECLPSAPTTTLARSVTVFAALGVAADARHAPVLDQDLLDREGLAHLRARRRGGLDQQRVEHDPPRASTPCRCRSPAAAFPRP